MDLEAGVTSITDRATKVYAPLADQPRSASRPRGRAVNSRIGEMSRMRASRHRLGSTQRNQTRGAFNLRRCSLEVDGTGVVLIHRGGKPPGSSMSLFGVKVELVSCT